LCVAQIGNSRTQSTLWLRPGQMVDRWCQLLWMWSQFRSLHLEFKMNSCEWNLSRSFEVNTVLLGHLASIRCLRWQILNRVILNRNDKLWDVMDYLLCWMIFISKIRHLTSSDDVNDNHLQHLICDAVRRCSSKRDEYHPWWLITRDDYWTLEIILNHWGW
jgi:hypothetical protein